jgi:hypothetical protein
MPIALSDRRGLVHKLALMDWPLLLSQLDEHAAAVQAATGAIQALTTVVLVTITVYYALQTRAQARAAKDTLTEMKAAREAESAPYIVVYFDSPLRGLDFSPCRSKHWKAAGTEYKDSHRASCDRVCSRSIRS